VALLEIEAGAEVRSLADKHRRADLLWWLGKKSTDLPDQLDMNRVSLLRTHESHRGDPVLDLD
jgi:hypothetical protein